MDGGTKKHRTSPWETGVEFSIKQLSFDVIVTGRTSFDVNEAVIFKAKK